MPYDARAVANFFIDFAQRERSSLTHLSLQKILFFAHGWHLAKYNSPLVGQGFEAWRYGPVVRVVYDQLKSFKSRPIDILLTKIDIETGAWVPADDANLYSRARFLADIFAYYSKFHAGQLVDLTHVEEGPWQRVWLKSVDNAVPGMLIPDEDIKNWILREGGRGGEATH